MIRTTYITLDKTDGSHIHVFSVFEQMTPDMQDAGDVGNRVLLPDNKRPSGFSATKDNLTFHARILPDTAQWNDVVSNPMSFIDVDSNNVQYHADADMLAVVNCKEFLEFEDKLKNTINSYHQHIKRDQVKCHVECLQQTTT